MHTSLLPCQGAKAPGPIRHNAGRGAVAGLVVALALELGMPTPLQQGVQHGLRTLAGAASTAMAQVAALP
jgi:hypothetical protein